MSEQRIIIETGMGSDLHGGDVNKAALRAVEDAMRRSSLPILGTLDLDHTQMRVQVTLGAHDPEAVDTVRIAAHMPRGDVSVDVVQGGLVVDDGIVIVTAAVEAFLPVQTGKWELSDPDSGDDAATTA